MRQPNQPQRQTHEALIRPPQREPSFLTRPVEQSRLLLFLIAVGLLALYGLRSWLGV